MVEKLRATPAARALANHLGIDLAQIAGTGERGRIQKLDVQNFENASSQKVSPLARAIAEDAGLDLSNIVGSGYCGKIMKCDVMLALKESATAQNSQSAGKNLAVNTSTTTKVASQTKTSSDSNNTSAKTSTTEEALSPMRKIIAKRMSESYLLAPSVTLNYEIDVTELMALRKKLIEPIIAETECKISFTDLVAFACIRCLAKPEHKYINASLNSDATKVIFNNDVNLALAVGFDGGLLTPVLYKAQNLKLSAVVAGLKDLAKRALSNKLAPGELSGSTFTISSLGMFGVDTFNPIINQPNSAILGVNAIVKRPWVLHDEIVVRPIMKLSLTVDHRLIDGLAAAKFMQDLKQTLENPLQMFI